LAQVALARAALAHVEALRGPAASNGFADLRPLFSVTPGAAGHNDGDKRFP